VLDLGTEKACIGRERLIEILDCDAEVVDAARVHAGEATERGRRSV
jgi:hypothetical protein